MELGVALVRRCARKSRRQVRLWVQALTLVYKLQNVFSASYVRTLRISLNRYLDRVTLLTQCFASLSGWQSRIPDEVIRGFHTGKAASEFLIRASKFDRMGTKFNMTPNGERTVQYIAGLASNFDAASSE